MPREARKKSKTGIYHIIWRGANRQEIFHDDEDWTKFLEILKKYKKNCELIIYTWCLMSNHVHLLIKEGNENISAAMKRIGVSYVGYYNWKYRTTGHLFQDRFKSEGVENRKYFLTVVRYIHQNPVKAGMVNQPAEWRWSSCRGYYGKSIYPKTLLDSDYVLKMFSDDIRVARKKFKEFNEARNNDKCLEDQVNQNRLTDIEARLEIKKLLGAMEIAQVKSLPKAKRNEVLQKVKGIDGLSLRQAARIFGVSLNLVFKA
ncbi:transposase [Cytobacillus oceanisediminis]|uniref:transposase n=1 Tax=Cytobacillus oceanisediminis TaxID=665099 RepID=UPI001D15AF44|nr:transposase [Cytobacillus oceanisediminis]MCC3648470.1 transposase [Cytobacillus oceanisediminis]